MKQAGDLSLGGPVDAPELDSAENQAWYLYGIIRSPHPKQEQAAGLGDETGPALGSLAVGDMTLELLSVGELAAVVRPVPRSDFTDEALQERLRDPQTLEEMVRAHNEIIAAIHDQQTILPAKLGGVYGRLEDLQEALEDGTGALRAQLDHVEGCDEWAVHVYAEREAIERQVASDHPSIRRLRDDFAKATPGRGYFLQRKLANDLAAATDTALTELAQSGYDQMRRLAVDGQVSVPSRAAGEREGTIEVLRAAFLVPRAGADAFVSAVDSFGGDRQGVYCDTSGPWPPYSFAAAEG